MSGVAAASPQSITFTLPASGTVGSTVELGATADSGLPVSYLGATPEVCTVDGTTLSLGAPGTCMVSASQTGDDTFAPATDVDASMTVEAAPPDPTPQAITFALPATGYVGSTVELSATADSGLTVTYTTSTPDACAVDATTLALLAAGTCTVTASQPGDDAWAPAPPVDASMTVALVPPDRSSQAITFTLPASGSVGSTVELRATADSGLAVSYSTSTPDVCTITGTLLGLVAVGTCTVTASQAGDGTWAPASDVQASMTVVLAPQTITFSMPASGLAGSRVKLAATAESGLGVSYASTTLGACTVVGTTLTLNAAGTCTVTASQAGNLAWAAAPDVQASMAVEPVPAGVDLGKYAVNGTVRAVVTDATTGRTYLGGDFTQIGLRTGPVAVVNPPDLGAGDLLASSPEVLGTVKAVFADDRPGDPGFFIVGELLAVNGEPVPAVPVTRMHLNPAGAKWVVDTAWTVPNAGACTIFGRAIAWTATDDYLIAGYATYSGSTTGFWTIDRETGVCSTSTQADIPVLPPLQDCVSLMYCQATVQRMAWDRASNRLLVWYDTNIGASPDTDTARSYLASYHLAAVGGSWLWITALQGDQPPDATNWVGSVTGIAAVDGRVLVSGWFPFEPEDAVQYGNNPTSRLLSLDSTTGVITQRWNSAGEQSLADGSALGSASPCLKASGSLMELQDQPASWVPDTQPLAGGNMLCTYAVTDGLVVASRVGSYDISGTADQPLTSTLYTAPGGATYLLGATTAMDLATGTFAAWNPDPGFSAGSMPGSIAVSTAGVIIAGDFSFVRGRSTPGVVALTSSLSPDPGFVSPLPGGSWPQGVRALALDGGWLLVGGFFAFPTPPGSDLDARSIVGLDPSSGRLLDWDASSQRPGVADSIAVNPENGEFWVGGSSHFWVASSQALAHFSAPADGALPLAAPSLTCLEAGGSYTSDTPVCAPAGNGSSEVRALTFDSAGNLYVAGAFGTVDGQVRRGLARLGPTGSVDAWTADLLGAVPIPDGSYLGRLVPYSLAILNNRLLVGGSFCSEMERAGGGGVISCISPLLVFSTETGALLRPTDPARSSWFQVFGWWSFGYSILASDTGVVVALGDVGIAVFDPVTLDFDAAASAPFLSTGWWAHDSRNGVFALASPTVPAGVSATSRLGVAAMEEPSTRVVLAGAISRWGDHVAGNMASAYIVATPDDSIAPTATAPAATLRTGVPLSGTSIRIHLAWSGADTGGSGINHYELARSTNGGTSWTTVASSLPSAAADVTVASSGTVRFRVRAIDGAGNPSAWATGPNLTPRLVQQSSTAVHYRGTWTNTSSSLLSGSSAKYAKAAGSYATYTFTGRSIALVATTASTRGKVKVYVNGALVATVDLRSSATRYRVLAWQKTWTTSATRTIKLVVVGTAGRPRVDLDAFVTVK